MGVSDTASELRGQIQSKSVQFALTDEKIWGMVHIEALDDASVPYEVNSNDHRIHHSIGPSYGGLRHRVRAPGADSE